VGPEVVGGATGQVVDEWDGVESEEWRDAPGIGTELSRGYWTFMRVIACSRT